MQCITVRNIAVYINTLRIGYVGLLKFKQQLARPSKNKGTSYKKNLHLFFFVIWCLVMMTVTVTWWQWQCHCPTLGSNIPWHLKFESRSLDPGVSSEHKEWSEGNWVNCVYITLFDHRDTCIQMHSNLCELIGKVGILFKIFFSTSKG